MSPFDLDEVIDRAAREECRQIMADLFDTPDERDAAFAWAVYDLAVKNPDRLNMYSWAIASTAGLVDLDRLTTDESGPGCGTTACYAGWAVALRGFSIRVADGQVCQRDGIATGVHTEEAAAAILGLSPAEAYHLFHTSENELEGVITSLFGPRPEVSS